MKKRSQKKRHFRPGFIFLDARERQHNPAAIALPAYPELDAFTRAVKQYLVDKLASCEDPSKLVISASELTRACRVPTTNAKLIEQQKQMLNIYARSAATEHLGIKEVIDHAKCGFGKGMTSAVDGFIHISGREVRPLRGLTSGNRKSVKDDWMAVGRDLATAFRRLTHERAE
jgi:hypothetical protein